MNQILKKYHYFLTYGSNSWMTLSNRSTENNLVENAEKNKGIQTNKWNKSYKYNFSWVRIKIETNSNYLNKKMLYPEKNSCWIFGWFYSFDEKQWSRQVFYHVVTGNEQQWLCIRYIDHRMFCLILLMKLITIFHNMITILPMESLITETYFYRDLLL